MTKQEALFKSSLIERYGKINDKLITINHETAECGYNGVKYGIIFPQLFIDKINLLDFNKKFEYNFIGIKTDNRKWVEGFNVASFINFTNNGRIIPKNYFDGEYYGVLCNSKFTLCPRGDFNWTYRFLEAIMCRVYQY